MNNSPADKKAAIPAANGFDQVGPADPRETMRQAGAQTLVVSPGGDDVKGRKTDHWGDSFEVEIKIVDSNAGESDALLPPGGVLDPDRLRSGSRTFRLVRGYVACGKAIATISPKPGARSPSQCQLF